MNKLIKSKYQMNEAQLKFDHTANYYYYTGFWMLGTQYGKTSINK